MIAPVWLVAVGILLAAALAAGVIRAGRASLLTRIRADWGQPIDRTRKLDAIFESHRSRVAGAAAAVSLDDRTWNDLDLDGVFVALDRTESTFGQHALYHRLRTAPVADDLGAFEALVSRMSADASARERAARSST